ncbi:nucleolar protein 6 isoform X2 [Thrips palmi]|uniref:Nucleolar protein 6 n=1 Tax=Thrips palmi TaxID=161013 RepID=A0A6P8Z5M2_THRPL|nr:nucleolar protein 6 isoform X2 [Thrips palmi]
MAAKFKKGRDSKKTKQKPVKKNVQYESDESLGADESEDLQFAFNLGGTPVENDVDDDYIDDDDDEHDGSSEEDGDDVLETLENNFENKDTRKRKNSENVDGSDATSLKKRKKSKTADLQKPPTAQEVARLRETENLFHSSLFRLQIEEMIGEISIKKKRISSFIEWFSSLKQCLSKIKSGEVLELMDQDWLENLGVSIPVVQEPFSLKGSFNFIPPSSISIVGSHAIGCSLGPHLNVDIAIEMPSKCFQGSDHINHRYHRKRALYLCQVIAHLKASGIISSKEDFVPRFELPRASNPLIPVVVVVPTGALQGRAQVHLHITVPEETFKLSKLNPSKNSVRSKWLFNEKTVSEGKDYATPIHNASILADLVAKQNETLKLETLEDFKNIKDGIILLKVWLRQRELDQGYSAFGSYLMTMLVVYLLRSRRLSSHMSSYQVARTVWNFLKESDWTSDGGGLTLCDKTTGGAPSLSEFHEHYEVVFVDYTGYCNLAAHLDAISFKRIKLESAMAVQYLDNPSVNSFQALFMKTAPFYRRFDHILCFTNISSLEEMNKKFASKKEKLDKGHHSIGLAAYLLLKVLQKGLGKRVSEWGIHIPQKVSWQIADQPTPSQGPLLIGINLDSEHAYSVLDKGPPADMPQAEEFRKFWGDKSELRRFQDGSISEAVVWLSEKDITLSQRRVINRQITEYLLKTKLGLDTSKCLVYLADQLEETLALTKCKPATFSYGTGEEATLAVLSALDKLAAQLRGLSDLPLDISGVQGSSPVCRYTDVFPPLSTDSHCRPGRFITKAKENCNVLAAKAHYSHAPDYVSPVEVVLQLALSGKWPDDAQAVRRVRTAFAIQIAESLRTQCGLTTQAFPNYVDVVKDGFVFRLRVAYQREPALLRQFVMPDGMVKIVDNKEAQILEREINYLPKITSFLHGLHQQQPAFGPAACLAKRWISSHMIRWSHFPEDAIELLVAHLFLCPEPFSPPAQPQIAFLRFLHLLSSTNWHLEPIILNFNNDMNREIVQEIEHRFTSERAQLPALFIATPSEHLNSSWTKEAPSLTILARVALLAAESLKVLQSCYLTESHLETNMWKQIFRPSLDCYNIIIHLNPSMISRNSQWIDAKVSEKIFALNPYKKGDNEKIPVVGYDAVQCYLQDLEEAYSDFAMFFHDLYGGNVIGVVWKPPAMEPKDFKISHMNGRKLEVNPTQLTLNKEALVEDFYILGKGLVKSIDVKDSSV